MKLSGRVPAFSLLCMMLALALSACDPKDFFGPEEGEPQPLDETFFPRTDPAQIGSDEMGAAIPAPLEAEAPAR
jgi:hypothetical protein